MSLPGARSGASRSSPARRWCPRPCEPWGVRRAPPPAPAACRASQQGRCRPSSTTTPSSQCKATRKSGAARAACRSKVCLQDWTGRAQPVPDGRWQLTCPRDQEMGILCSATQSLLRPATNPPAYGSHRLRRSRWRADETGPVGRRVVGSVCVVAGLEPQRPPTHRSVLSWALSCLSRRGFAVASALLSCLCIEASLFRGLLRPWRYADWGNGVAAALAGIVLQRTGAGQQRWRTARIAWRACPPRCRAAIAPRTGASAWAGGHAGCVAASIDSRIFVSPILSDDP